MKHTKHIAVIVFLLIALSQGAEQMSGKFPHIFQPESTPAQVAKIVDGDTIRLTNGETVRLLQIDTPEKYRTPECFGKAATRTLERLLPIGSHIRLENDPASAPTDRYGRRLAYVFLDERNINIAMVRNGAATPYFYQGELGKYAPHLLRAVAKAKQQKIGMWRACSVSYDPSRGVSTGPTS